MRRDRNNGNRDKQRQKRDVTGRDTLARARPPTEGCHGVTRDNWRDTRRDSDTPAGGRCVTVTAAAPRFDAWLAGATAEQQARWERLHGKPAVDDNELPPALRGGALEVF